MTLKEFLDKETPPEGGCMLVAVPRKDDRLKYLLIERFKKCAYIGDDKGGSGISVKEETVEALATSVAGYIKDYFG